MRTTRNKNKKKSKAPIIDGGLGFAFVAGALLEGCANYQGPSAGVNSYSFKNDTSTLLENSELITGRAINGYLIDAFVFQDVDNNGLYSANEPLALTNANGLFTIDKALKGDVLVKPINHLSDSEKINSASKLASYGINNPDAITTYYVNESGLRTEFNGQLEISQSMLSQGLNITPLTTIVNGLIKSGIYDVTEANQKVTSIFKLPATTDYIQLSKSSNSLAAADGLALQKKSVAISNLLTSSIEIFKNDLEGAQVVDKLAVELVTAIEALELDNENFDISQFLASEQELKNIITDIAQSNNIEINVTDLSTIVNNLQSLNSRFKDQSKAYLIEDTGRSGIDLITNKHNITPPANELSNNYLYSVEYTNNILDNFNEPTVWVSSQQDLQIRQGYNTIFYKLSTDEFNKLNSITFYYDNIAPSVNTAVNSEILSTNKSKWFSDNGNIYIRDIQINHDFYTSNGSSAELVFPEYQLINYLSSEQIGDADANNWLDFINFSSRNNFNGLQLRLYSRAVDIAGNAGASSHLDFYYDNVAPNAIQLENVILEEDTGLYENDRVSNKLTINEITQNFSSSYDENSSKLLYSWLTDTNTNNITYTDILTTPTADGNYWLAIKNVDRAGNESEITLVDFILDTIAPIVNSSTSFTSHQNSLSLNFNADEINLNEWYQYKFVNPNNPDNDNNLWSDINVMTATGNYEVFYRKTDRAGNHTEAFLAGSKYLDFDAPDSSNFLIDNSKIYSSESTKEYFLNEIKNTTDINTSKNLFSTSTINTQHSSLVVDEFFYTESDIFSNVSDPLSFQFLKDNTIREVINITDENSFLIKTKNNQPTSFLTSASTQESLIALGSSESDKLSSLSVGDIFLGLGGIDIAYISPNLTPNGVSFLDASEINLLSETFPNILTDLELQNIKDIPVLKIYLENNDDPDSSGISIAQSDIFSYKSQNKLEFFYTQWNSNLNAWFLNLGANNDNLYFGGNDIHVLGGTGSDILQGGAGSDYLVANSNLSGSQDVLRGFAGSDTLIGGDYLFLSHADFVLDGGNDNDFLIIGNGTSDVEGGAGLDTFIVAPINDSTVAFHSVITDFDPTQDKLIFNNLSENIYKGVFINESDSTVVFDLSLILGSDKAPYGSTLTLTNISDPTLLPEDIISNWISFDSDFSFEWSDLSIDSISLLS